MASLKCKMCGGDLELTPNSTVAECQYCGTKQTVPNADSEKKMTLFSRANRLRFNCEFDKAAGVYETIIGEFPEEAEAYWGLVLCKYGIEYVDDPATGKKIPTCHRSSFDSVMEDENLELAMEYADAVAKRIYREEAKQIEDIRKRILEVSSKEEPYDIFICYKETDDAGERTLDSVLAQDIYDELTGKGYRVFFSRITLEDKLGQEYEPYIFAALHSARIMLAVGTCYEHFDAVWVKNEWSRYLQLIAAGEKKTLIPCYKDLDAYDMPKEFAKFQAQDLGKVGAMQDLLRGVEKILGKGGKQNAFAVDLAVSGMAVLNAQTESLLKRGYISLKDRKFAQAKELFDQVLNNDPECAQAYFGKVLAGRKVQDKEELLRVIIRSLEEEADNTDELVDEAVLEPNIPLAAIARDADAQTEILSEFSDDELESLLTVEFDIKPIRYRKCLSLYELWLENYSTSLEQIQALVCISVFEEVLQDYKRMNNGNSKGIDEYYKKVKSDYEYKDDFNHAIEYAKGDARQEIETIWTGVTDWIKGRIKDENQIPIKWQEEQEKKSIEIKEAISGWLRKAAGNIAGQNAEAKAVQKKAEEKAEADYQAAVQAIKLEYERQLDAWKKAKAAYPAQYDAAVAKQLELREKIAQLEQEKTQLKGFFIGKKRKELETNIAQLQGILAAVIPPQDLGEPPVCGSLPNREDFYKDVRKNKNEEKVQTAAAVFPVFQELQPVREELARVAVGEKVYFGKYPYNENENIQEIQWRVLDKKGKSLLLLTEYGIAREDYHKKDDRITWEKCTLRRWLNEEFLNKAFSDSEKKLIQTTNVDNSQSENYSKDNTSDGNNTEDQVFLLSYKEAFEDYFSSDEERVCMSAAWTVYDEEEPETCSWWLRSPSTYRYEWNKYVVTVVNGYGFHSSEGVTDYDNRVRPALWLNLESGIF